MHNVLTTLPGNVSELILFRENGVDILSLEVILYPYTETRVSVSC
jgi:hypothetical protein